MLEVQKRRQGLEKLLVPVGIRICNAHAVKELLNIVLDHLSVDLKQQHQIRERRLCETDTLPRLEYLL